MSAVPEGDAVRSLPSGKVSGTVVVPASKSVAQRVLNLALLARTPIAVGNSAVDQDSLAFLRVLQTLGWTVDTAQEQSWHLTPPQEYPDGGSVDCGSSGTGFRFLLAALSTLPGRWHMQGSDQLAARPIDDLVQAIRAAGGTVQQASPQISLPIDVDGGSWRAAHLEIEARASSQFVSAVLMAATQAKGEVTFTVRDLVSAHYVDLTLDWMHQFGADVQRIDHGFRVRPGLVAPERVALEGDWSSAAYPAAAAALTGGRVRLVGLQPDSAQGDRQFFDLLQRMGARVSWHGHQVEVSGTGSLQALDVDLNAMPDQVPTLACLAPFANGTTVIRGVAHLRYKESDRLSVLTRELTRVGAQVEELADGLRIEGTWFQGDVPHLEAEIDPQDDHRIAMAMAVLASERPGLQLRQPDVVAKSYAGFWQDWDSLFGWRALPANEGGGHKA